MRVTRLPISCFSRLTRHVPRFRHSDFPYSGHHTFSVDFPKVPMGRYPAPEESILGLQYNVCIDPFTIENGGTMFALGSALEGTGPPAEWADLSMVDEVPPGGASGRGSERRAEQLEGPPGTAILYDARTWHRQHANLSDSSRTALLFVCECSSGPAWAVAVAATLTVDRCCEQTRRAGSCRWGTRPLYTRAWWPTPRTTQ